MTLQHIIFLNIVLIAICSLNAWLIFKLISVLKKPEKKCFTICLEVDNYAMNSIDSRLGSLFKEGYEFINSFTVQGKTNDVYKTYVILKFTEK